MRTLRWIVGQAIVAACLAAPGLAQDTGRLAGRVVGPDSLPLAGVTITVTAMPAEPGISVVSARSGEFEVAVPAGRYRIRAALRGYRVATQLAAVVAGRRVDVKIALSEATAAATVFDADAMNQVPSARSLWSLATRSPDVITSTGVDVGGTAAGQQLTLAARGEGLAGASWLVDGLVFTDMRAVGSALIYPDFGALAGLAVTTAGADLSQQTPGVRMSLVSRDGSGQLRGSARLWYTDASWQSNNVGPDLFARGAGPGVPLDLYRESGLEVGGPLMAGRLRWWAAYGDQAIDSTTLGFYPDPSACGAALGDYGALDELRNCLVPNRTRLRDLQGSVAWRPGAAQGVRVRVSGLAKTSSTRGASPTATLAATPRQHGRSLVVSASHTWLPQQHIAIETMAGWVRSPFSLDFQTPDLAATQAFEDLATGTYSRSLRNATENQRASASLDVRGTLDLPSPGRSVHRLRFGAGYRRVPSSTYWHAGGDGLATYSGAEPLFFTLYRDGSRSLLLQTASTYVEDSLTWRRLTVSGGLRVDHQDDAMLPSSVPANSIRPDLLPASAFGGDDSPVDLTDAAPRVAASFDVGGDGRTVVSTAFRTYDDQGLSVSMIHGDTLVATVSGCWPDRNGDRIIQPSEVDIFGCGYDFRAYYGYFALGPKPVWTTDPSLRNGRVREAVARFDRELSGDISLGASYVFRRSDRYQWNLRTGDDASRYIEKPWTDPATGLEASYYELLPQANLGAGRTVTNQPGRHVDYGGLTVELRKRLSRGWALGASAIWQRSIAHYPPGSYTDPTNIGLRDGRPGDLTLPRYVIRADGLMELPAGMRLAAAVNVQDGFIREIGIDAPPRFQLSSTTLLLDPLGTSRYPTLTLVDLQVSKAAEFGAGGRYGLTLGAVVFNLLNADTIISAVNDRSQADFDHVLAMVGPRVFRVGVAIGF